ncbi:MAG TPA: response regulator transcription factor [Cyclobacteriaceae bacterium]|nr:response regulator transcription factor [Cyclobacteriaceae bacterium]HRJ82715.1 response regulator transcription factor [Cyclobacteriaceae bacterium]
MNNKSLLVLVVDDHRMVCEALVALVEKTGLCKKALPAYRGEEALSILQQERIAIALVDIRMPGLSGSNLVKRIEREHPTVKIVGMTSFDDEDTIQEMLQLNLAGILLKRSTTRSEINTCLEKVSEGKTYVTDELKKHVQVKQLHPARAPRTNFTGREMQVLTLLSEGHSSKLIAEHLNLKASTIEDYRKGMLKKTKTKSTAGLVAFAMRNGLL